MIGSGLKKYAKEFDMKVDSGVAYGVMNGYAVTLQEGSGYKQMAISTRFAEMEQQRAFEQQINAGNVASKYRVQRLSITPNCIIVVFTDSLGTMNKIRDFWDWLLPLLQANGASLATVCNECGGVIYDGGVWMLRDGIAASHVHEACANKVKEALLDENSQRAQEDRGSYATGAAGAFIGALLGAVVWAIVLMAGFVAGLVGLLIGFFANTGYNLMKGKQGKAKIAILVLAIIAGVLIGTIGGYALITLESMNMEGIETEYFGVCFGLLMSDSYVQSGLIRDVLVGLLFAGLGVYGLLKQEQKKIIGETVKILK